MHLVDMVADELGRQPERFTSNVLGLMDFWRAKNDERAMAVFWGNPLEYPDT